MSRARPRAVVLAAVVLAAVVLAAVVLGTSCTSAPERTPGAGTAASGRMVAQIASYEHLAGVPNRVLVGLVAPDGQRLVTFGSVALGFFYTGPSEEPTEPRPGPEATATYIPVPGTPDEPSAARPAASQPSEARGVYAATGVVFDRAGFWQVEAEADVEDLGRQTATATLSVLEEPSVPAPGRPALPTENLTTSSGGAPPEAVDSRAATNGGRIPAPAIHRWTIAEALEEGRPVLVLFSTPVHCVSRFCGPVTNLLARLERRYGDLAVFIHVEIWRDFQESVVNRAAADWLLRDGEIREPFLFLIGPDGMIEERWDNLFSEEEVVAALASLPS